MDENTTDTDSETDDGTQEWSEQSESVDEDVASESETARRGREIADPDRSEDGPSPSTDETERMGESHGTSETDTTARPDERGVETAKSVSGEGYHTARDDDDTSTDDVKTTDSDSDTSTMTTDSESSQDQDEDRIRELEQRLADVETELEAVTTRVADLESQLEDHRRRSERERNEIRQYAVDDFAEDILHIKDNLIAAIEIEDLDDDAEERLQLLNREFEQALESANIEPIDDPEESFDSIRHKVVDAEASDEHESREIIDVVEPGYAIGDRVLRPARVVIAS